MSKQTYLPQKLSHLLKGLEVTVQGDTEVLIQGVNTIQAAKAGEITFLTNKHYAKYLADTNASAVILSPDAVQTTPATLIITRNPHYVYAKIAAQFTVKQQAPAGIHPTAVIGNEVVIHPTASIGAGVVIGDHTKIGASVVIGPGTVIGQYCDLAEGVQCDARVTLYDGVIIGERSDIASGAVIGSRGFGFANEKGHWHSVPQLGIVRIGKEVSIGANTTIDCGAIEDTIIGDGVKLDNLIQVGHNVVIGDHTIIAGCSGIAGSTKIGKYCMMGGSTMIAGHIEIADKVVITGRSNVMKSIKESGIYSSTSMSAVPVKENHKMIARVNQLPHWIDKIKALESLVKSIEERVSS